MHVRVGWQTLLHSPKLADVTLHAFWAAWKTKRVRGRKRRRRRRCGRWDRTWVKRGDELDSVEGGNFVQK